MLICWALLAGGCAGGRTVLVPESAPMRIGPEVRGRVYVMIDGEWVLRPDRIRLPEGWYLVSPSFVDADEAGAD